MQQFASSGDVHSRQPCAAHSVAASYSVAALGHEMAMAAALPSPAPWHAESPPLVQMDSPHAPASVQQRTAAVASTERHSGSTAAPHASHAMTWPACSGESGGGGEGEGGGGEGDGGNSGGVGGDGAGTS